MSYLKSAKKYTLIILLVISVSFFNTNLLAQNALQFTDSRATPSSPISYGYKFEPHFKSGSTLGLSEDNGNAFYSVLGFRGWGDDSGGKGHELAFSNDGQVFWRSGYSIGWENWRKFLISDQNGNVGIGTSTPTEKLSVSGKIRAKEVKVEATNWPDYVFEEGYKLPTLVETEKHIKEKGYLLGLPSAKEVEQNGIELGEMNKLLLKKIEELTIYIINLNKKVDLQERIIKKQNRKN